MHVRCGSVCLYSPVSKVCTCSKPIVQERCQHGFSDGQRTTYRDVSYIGDEKVVVTREWSPLSPLKMHVRYGLHGQARSVRVRNLYCSSRGCARNNILRHLVNSFEHGLAVEMTVGDGWRCGTHGQSVLVTPNDVSLCCKLVVEGCYKHRRYMWVSPGT